MALPLSSPSTAFLKASTPAMQAHCLKPRIRYSGFITNCEPPSSGSSKDSPAGSASLRIGSPVIVIEAPATLKTAGSMPSLKVNMGLVKQGDVGRIVARKPKDVWAVRLTLGTFLMDGKYFKPLDLDE
ncbi:hypothetical protein MRB53_002670 [Persea americana]|uniref:Uncharacterized protein n=1 Tax=Persea americana TaxID=3435 RepID=A0ACC2MV09_PERAE|nr:hypothetical protein MRB53_002670 [Persea americana]